MCEGFSKKNEDDEEDNSNTGDINPYNIDHINNNKKNHISNNVISRSLKSRYGISKKDIPKGSEDLYILKSQIVPPVCPACPSVTTCPSEKKCRPCPPCARCPEPSFECKKVPNYSVANNNIPRPVLNDFSAFGM